jgi:hypothetical protein
MITIANTGFTIEEIIAMSCTGNGEDTMGEQGRPNDFAYGREIALETIESAIQCAESEYHFSLETHPHLYNVKGELIFNRAEVRAIIFSHFPIYG